MLARAFAPVANTARIRFDAIIVLGTPADGEGNPTPAQLARVTEAVHEYERGVAPRLILTGGASEKEYVEAHVMAHSAEAMGVPASSIFEEPKITQRRVTSACTCSTADLLALAVEQVQAEVARRCVIFGCWSPRGERDAAYCPEHRRRADAGLLWPAEPAAQTAREPESGLSQESAAALVVLKSLRYLVYARWADRCTP